MATDPKRLAELIGAAAWTSQVRSNLDLRAVATWDANIVRQPRLLVPMQVQALHVPPGNVEPVVPIPFALADAAMPEPFSDGEPLASGVHLHFSMPAALLRGSLSPGKQAGKKVVELPALPDRFCVIRLLAPTASDELDVQGWMLDATTAQAVPLTEWPQSRATAARLGREVTPEELTGTAGGSVSWSATYAATRNRFSFHDPLTSIGRLGRIHEDQATYVVLGFWSKPELDVLDKTQTEHSFNERLDELGWTTAEDGAIAEDGEDGAGSQEPMDPSLLGLLSGQRYILALTAQATEKAIGFNQSAVADQAGKVATAAPTWPRQTLLYGIIDGVPVTGPVLVDQRPAAPKLELALGRHTEELVATLCRRDALRVGTSVEDEGAEAERNRERVLTAFSANLLSSITTSDGVVAIDEYEHRGGFDSQPGGNGGIDRLKAAGEAGPFVMGRSGRAGKTKSTGGARTALEATLDFLPAKVTEFALGGKRSSIHQLRRSLDAKTKPKKPQTTSQVRNEEPRTIQRPAPRFFRPIEPQLAIAGAQRNTRFFRKFSVDGKLRCRLVEQLGTSNAGIEGADLVPSLGSGAVPTEALAIVRSAAVHAPFLTSWLAQREARRRVGIDRLKLSDRLMAEAILRRGVDGSDPGAAVTTLLGKKTDRLFEAEFRKELAVHSMTPGVMGDEQGEDNWAQPWVPLFLEYELELKLTDRADDWQLGAVDLDPPEQDSPQELSSRRVRGRVALHAGAAESLKRSIEERLAVEEQLDRDGHGEIEADVQATLANLKDAIDHLDILTGSLEGISHELLGLPRDPFGSVRRRGDDGQVRPMVPQAPPQLLAAGSLQLLRARLVDAFGRTLDLPVQDVRTPTDESLAEAPGELRVRPRLSCPARWLFRFTDPSDLSLTSPEANIDQVEPQLMINPVAGFLLPDHIDEALEVFDISGNPLGQLTHEPTGGGVAWEIAPGRNIPVDAGPSYDLKSNAQILGYIASGLVAADARARDGQARGPAEESALSALLRAIDTTLWSVDTFSGFGSEHIAGLVGRPIAVVRALLRLDLKRDLDDLDLTAPGARELREAAYRSIRDRVFPVRLGEITRSDDGLLGFFVDDDYSRFHVVDRVVLEAAFDSGKGNGHFQALSAVETVPGTVPITNTYLVAEDELRLHPDQVVRLTLLMHPASKVHLTSGILPRKQLALAREWVAPGLSKIAPSARVGPVLIESGPVSLPKVSAFPKDQLWTRRDSAYTWKTDPILAATQTATLPNMPAELQEGYICIGQTDPTAEEGS